MSVSASSIVVGFYASAIANLIADVLYLQAVAFGNRALVVPGWAMAFLLAPIIVAAPLYMAVFRLNRGFRLDQRFLRMALSVSPSTAFISVLLFTSAVRLLAMLMGGHASDLSPRVADFQGLTSNMGALTIVALVPYTYMLVRLLRAIRTVVLSPMLAAGQTGETPGG